MKALRNPSILSLGAILLITCGPVEEGVFLEVSTDVPELDRLTVTVLNPNGALLLDEPLPASGDLRLPGRIQLDAAGRTEELRFLVWGFRENVRAAFGAARSSDGTGKSVPLKLTAAPPDRDGDLIPDGWDGCPGVSDPRQEDSNANGVTNACAPLAETCPGNILANPGFDEDTSGWSGVHGEEETVGPGHRGLGAAARICRSDSDPGFTLEEVPPRLKDPEKGKTYRVDAWVRAEPGQTLSPVIREVGPGDLYVGSSDPMFDTTGEWQFVSTQYAVKGDASVELLVEFTSWDAPAGACFEVDEVCFVEVTE
jgi:hypothetical protein